MSNPALHDIERDLRAFADPGTDVIISGDSAVWEQDGGERSVKFLRRIGADVPDVEYMGRRLSYRAFLAGPDMADLGRLAEFIQKTTRASPNFVETGARIEDEEGQLVRQASATTLVASRATEELPAFSTRVVLVQGEAGSGKTIALREMALRQAAHFSSGDEAPLFFYVDAQGRALSRLEDAMAKDLQDLRSRFSYAAIAPLTRRSLLVPIIDGFDELLGSGGYDEAFSSLAALLSTLDGQGAVIASARSAFFDYRNFYENARKYSRDGRLNYVVDPVKVEAWGEAEVRAFVGASALAVGKEPDRAVGVVEDMMAELDDPNRALLEKPFYVSRITELVLDGIEISTETALLDQLVEAFVEREHRKLLDKEGTPLLSVKGHRAFLGQLAEEMWWQEARRIDVGTVQTVAELVTESFGLPPGSAKAIVERVSSYAFLSTADTDRNTLKFEHEVFYGYFLAHKLKDAIEREASDLRRFLNRSILDEPLADQAVRLIGVDVERCTRAVESICGVIRPALSDIVARENAGRILARLIGQAGSLRRGVKIENVILRQQALGESALIDIAFLHCDLEDVDFTRCRVHGGEFRACTIRGMIVDLGHTRLDGVLPSVLDQTQSVFVVAGSKELGPGRYFAPGDVRTALAELGVPLPTDATAPSGYSGDVKERIHVLERFLQKMERRFYASEEDIASFGFVRSPEWSMVSEFLSQHGLVVDEFKQKSGPKEALKRLAYPPEVIRRGEDVEDGSLPREVRAFWRDLIG